MVINKAKYINEKQDGVKLTFEDSTTFDIPTFENRYKYTDLFDEWVDGGGEVEAYKTEAEKLQAIEDAKPKVVKMAQARLALLQSGLLSTINTAIINGTDEAMKIEWEYATEIKRDHVGLIALTESLGMTSAQLDDLFLLASEM